MEAIEDREGLPHPGPIRTELRSWAVALLLMAPMLVPYLVHFFGPSSGAPTGFIHLEMPYYMANAREHHDRGGFRLFYANPYDAREDAPPIYFQPHILLLGAAQGLTGLDPGLIFAGFGLLAAWACCRVALSLYRAVVGTGSWPGALGLVMFFWGGGLLSLTGLLHGLATRGTVAFEDHLTFDPFKGWWFLNFGRNLIFPTEAFYHALFFGAVVAAIRRRFLLATVLAGLVSISHPFTGIELLLILSAWAALEVRFLGDPGTPRWFLRTMVILVGLHLAYYLGYLGGFPEHRAVMDQWRMDWQLEARSFVPAYALVAALAVWSFRRVEPARRFFALARNRLFLVWAVVAFVLANHEFAVRPVQPLHFTRGYIWTPLFLMGAPALAGLIAALRTRGGRVLGPLAVGGVLTLFLTDNALWLATFPHNAWLGRPCGDVRLEPEAGEVLAWLDTPGARGCLVITDDSMLTYLTSTYTPLRTWIGHPFNTPDYARRVAEQTALFRDGQFLSYWRRRPLLVVSRTGPGAAPVPAWATAHGGREVFRNAAFVGYRFTPVVPPGGLARGTDGAADAARR